MENQNAVLSTKHVRADGPTRASIVLLIARLAVEQAILERLILATPTSPVRDELTSANIVLIGALTFLRDLL